MEPVFKALGDPTRRRILDRLFERDGQTLSALEEDSGMTRFGVMKHLRVLQDAGLVVVRRSGREKLHYLNPVPIQLIYDRWISKYAAPWARRMSDLKSGLEAQQMSDPTHVYQVYIKTTPQQLWRAITDPEMTRQYFFGSTVESDWKPGSSYKMSIGDAVPVWGEIVECDPPRRLVQTFETQFGDDAGGSSLHPTRVTWQIEPMGDVCKLTLLHEGFGEDQRTYEAVGGGWPMILSGLKTLLETGKPIAIPHS